MFVDEAEISVRSGDGGAGSVSFRREKYVPRGGPDGGDGGKGGDVVFVVRSNVKTLSYVKMRQRFFAKNGQGGAGRQRNGAKGQDSIIEVPPGTAVYDSVSGERLLDLVEPGSRHLLFEGGRGGKGNAHFKSSRHQAPRFAQPGEEGTEAQIRVELQVIADIGFVGLPNVGKSTLLKVLTAADPKIGNYPFTTVIPNLGVMHHFERDVVLADIPGIIEGASAGAGLGIRFLKHIQRTNAIAYVIEATDPDPCATMNLLVGELARYDHSLTLKPRLLLRTKDDLCQTSGSDGTDFISINQEECDSGGPGRPKEIRVSAMSRSGLGDVADAIAELAVRSDEAE